MTNQNDVITFNYYARIAPIANNFIFGKMGHYTKIEFGNMGYFTFRQFGFRQNDPYPPPKLIIVTLNKKYPITNSTERSQKY